MKQNIIYRTLLKAGLPLAVALTAPTLTHGQTTVAEYTFDTNFQSTIAQSTDLDPNSTATDFDVHYVATAFDSGMSVTSHTAFAYSDDTANTLAGAIAGNHYFSFTVTPHSGQLNLNKLSFDTVYNGPAAAAAVNVHYVVQSSADGFGSNIADFTESYQTTWNWTSRTVDLSGASFQNIGSEVEFRIYIYDNSNTNERIVRLDNLALTAFP